MKFGVREICDVVFRAKSTQKIGSMTFQKGQPVLYIDTAKTSTLEGSGTTVYAQGGKGNPRLIAWEGEKTLTFTVEDALLSPIGFAILSGAGLLGGKNGTDSTSNNVHVHTTTITTIDKKESVYSIDLSDAIGGNETLCSDAPIYVIAAEDDDSLQSAIYKVTGIEANTGSAKLIIEADTGYATPVEGAKVFVDYYVLKPEYYVDEIQIDAAHFAGSYYVEASTLFRRQSDGVDMPAQLTLPNVKIQSNFTFSMAPSGDPSTFTFTMDAFPGYTYFNPTKKVLCVIQVIDNEGSEDEWESVMRHKNAVAIAESINDSTPETTASHAVDTYYTTASAPSSASTAYTYVSTAAYGGITTATTASE